MERINRISHRKTKTSFFTKCLCGYFALMLCDIFSIGAIGTMLKIYAVFLILISTMYLSKAKFDRLFFLEIFYLIALLFSTIYSISQKASISSFITIALNFGLVIVCQSIEFSEKEIESLQKSLMVGGVLILIASLFFADFTEGNRLTVKIMDDIADQNYLNGYLLFSFGYFSHALLFKQGKKRWNLLFMIITLLFTFATGSRGALLALLGIVGTLLFIKVKNNKKQLFQAFLFVIGLIVLFSVILMLLPEEVAIRYSLEYIEENGTTNRSDIWKALLTRLFQDDLFSIVFGKGIATTQFYNTFSGHVAHNAFIEILVGAGVIGLTLFVGLFYMMFKRAWISKNYMLFSVFVGFLVMNMSLSIIDYKPMFNMFLMIEICYKTYQKNNIQQV